MTHNVRGAGSFRTSPGVLRQRPFLVPVSGRDIGALLGVIGGVIGRHRGVIGIYFAVELFAHIVYNLL